MSVVQHAPSDASPQPIGLELDRLGLELAAANLELEMITQTLLRDAREVLAIMTEDVHSRAPVPERSRQAARSPRTLSGVPTLPVRVRPGNRRGTALRRLFVIVPVACVTLLAGVAALDTLQSTGSVSKPAGGARVRQREDATLTSRDRLSASLGTALQPPATPSGSSPGRKADVRTFSWPAVPTAAYEFILLRGQERVFSRRVLTPRLTLPASWTYRGKRQLLRPGMYRWIVLPVRGLNGGRVGKAVVAARLVVR